MEMFQRPFQGVLDDYAAGLKVEAYRLRGWEMTVGRGSVVTKLVAAYLATVRAGAVFLPLNTAYQLAELDYFFGDAQPSFVVAKPETVEEWLGENAGVADDGPVGQGRI